MGVDWMTIINDLQEIRLGQHELYWSGPGWAQVAGCCDNSNEHACFI